VLQACACAAGQGYGTGEAGLFSSVKPVSTGTAE
jgi:hypothetical protein